MVKEGHKWQICFRNIFSKFSLNIRSNKTLWKETKHCFCSKPQVVYFSEIVYQLFFFHKADRSLLEHLHIAQNLGVFLGGSPVSFEHSESGNEERPNRHPSPICFLLMGLKSGCCLCSWGEISWGEWSVGKKKKNPNSPSSSWEVTFLIFLTVARSLWRAMDLRSQRTPIFVQRKGNWDGLMAPHDLLPSRFCVQVVPSICWESYNQWFQHWMCRSC